MLTVPYFKGYNMTYCHLNVIYNVNIKASNIHLRKYSGCDLDNFEKSYGKDGY
uniref:Uncharacterized protein n=1 Tax=Rhizophagus irregularis (strain DAOM 181602 / DAOM 197198 / MUCL 43194) TaxID=747089 RepID=U9TY16_RHIID